MISAKIIEDSINPDGKRLTTFECTFNRWILAELNTHRMLSRNSASSRAIPINKIISQVWKNPAYPVFWGKNQAGMQSKVELKSFRLWLAKRLFFFARIPAIIFVWMLSKVKMHKQVSNRILEPWMWHTAIVSSTEWSNFFKLRLHPDAQPEFQELARCMKTCLDKSIPVFVDWGNWHTPYVSDENEDGLINAKISAACCARVSYVRQNDRKSVDEDINMSNRLIDNGHYSPLEHPAQAVKDFVGGNFTGGWKQLRKFYIGEDGK